MFGFTLRLLIPCLHFFLFLLLHQSCEKSLARHMNVTLCQGGQRETEIARGTLTLYVWASTHDSTLGESAQRQSPYTSLTGSIISREYCPSNPPASLPN